MADLHSEISLLGGKIIAPAQNLGMDVLVIGTLIQNGTTRKMGPSQKL
jgi:hypothetical protein